MHGSCCKSSILFLRDGIMKWGLKVLSSIFNYKIFLLIFMDLSNLCVPKYLRNLIIDSLTMCRVFALMRWTSTTLLFHDIGLMDKQVKKKGLVNYSIWMVICFEMFEWITEFPFSSIFSSMWYLPFQHMHSHMHMLKMIASLDHSVHWT